MCLRVHAPCRAQRGRVERDDSIRSDEKPTAVTRNRGRRGDRRLRQNVPVGQGPCRQIIVASFDQRLAAGERLDGPRAENFPSWRVRLAGRRMVARLRRIFGRAANGREPPAGHHDRVAVRRRSNLHDGSVRAHREELWFDRASSNIDDLRANVNETITGARPLNGLRCEAVHGAPCSAGIADLDVAARVPSDDRSVRQALQPAVALAANLDGLRSRVRQHSQEEPPDGRLQHVLTPKMLAVRMDPQLRAPPENAARDQPVKFGRPHVDATVRFKHLDWRIIRGARVIMKSLFNDCQPPCPPSHRGPRPRP